MFRRTALITGCIALLPFGPAVADPPVVPVSITVSPTTLASVEDVSYTGRYAGPAARRPACCCVTCARGSAS